MRELLIRYLLGELEPHEHDDVQRQLAASPELRKELAHLRSCFASSFQADEPAEPPRGLAERTSVRVAESDSYDALPKSASAQASSTAIGQMYDPPAGALGWSLADLTVAGGVILAVSMLMFPALRQSRDDTRRTLCANNQRQMWVMVASFQQNNPGRYVPMVQPNENAGTYVLRLVEGDYISRENLKPLLICPDSLTATLVKSGQFKVEIPTSEELHRMSPQQRALVTPRMSPDYAYCFGYRNGQQYFYIRGNGPTPFLADAPGEEEDGFESRNHGGIVQFASLDGSVKARTSCKVAEGKDDLYRNILGVVAAGFGRQDAVLGKSEATPALFGDELPR